MSCFLLVFRFLPSIRYREIGLLVKRKTDTDGKIFSFYFKGRESLRNCKFFRFCCNGFAARGVLIRRETGKTGRKVDFWVELWYDTLNQYSRMTMRI